MKISHDTMNIGKEVRERLQYIEFKDGDVPLAYVGETILLLIDYQSAIRQAWRQANRSEER